MEWLRCNKCYREMNKTKRTFSVTQCGHLYCSRCLADVTAKCAVCGTQNFKTMTLGDPSKLELQNFFTPTDEYLETGIKIEVFQNNQLCVVARGFEESELEGRTSDMASALCTLFKASSMRKPIWFAYFVIEVALRKTKNWEAMSKTQLCKLFQKEKKYENMKKMYWNGMKEMNLLAQSFQKLEAKTAKLEAFGNSLLKAREVENVDAESSGSSFLRYAQGHQNKSNWGNFGTPNKSDKRQVISSSRQYEDQRNTHKYPATDSFPAQSKLQTPEQTYDPRTPRSSGGIDSASSGTDSGLWSIPGSSSNRMGVFRVPSAQKVPKSAATLKKNTPTP